MRRFPKARLPNKEDFGKGTRVIGTAVNRGVARIRRIRIRRMRSVISPADLFTLGNAFAGLLAITVLTEAVKLYEPPFFPGLDQIYPAVRDDRFLIATMLLAFGLVCDSLDGTVARKFGGSRLGGDLDTLADSITFVLLPAVMVFSKYGPVAPFPAMLAGALVFLMGILRLARFNSNPVESETKDFQGLPTPWAAVTIALMIMTSIPSNWALPITAMIAFLMMSNAAYPKSRGDVRYISYLMMVVALGVVVFLVFFPASESRILRTLFVIAALSVAVSPLLLARKAKRESAAAAATGPAPPPGEPR